MSDWFYLEVDKAHIAKERRKARELKQTQWWKNKISQGICHYCEQKFSPGQLTMDHIVPLARGGMSNKGNIVAACKKCNENKKLKTPVDIALEEASKKE